MGTPFFCSIAPLSFWLGLQYLLYVLQCFIENLVFPGPDSCEGGMGLDIWLQTQSLELASIGMPNALAAEVDVDSSRQRQVRHVAVGSLSGASHDFRAVGCFKEEAGVLGLADGALVDEHDRTAVISRFFSVRNSLIKGFQNLGRSEFTVGKIG